MNSTLIQRPPTRAADALYTLARGLRYIFGYILPLWLVLTYRAIPAALRGRIFGGPSTSHLALTGIREGKSWDAVFSAIQMNNLPDPPY